MKETEELVPSKISVSQICLFRKGSDIDLQAIFGGRITSKRKNESKTNPVYKDGQNGLKRRDKSENDMGGLEIKVYKNIPTEDKNHKNDTMKEQLKKENSRDKVTVTNGDICVGDIIIENGYRNPAFDSNGDHSDIQEHTLNYSGEGEGKANMSGSDWPSIDDIALPADPSSQDEAYEVIDYNRNSTKVKNVDPNDIDIDVGDNSLVSPTSDDSGIQDKVDDESDSYVIIHETSVNHIEEKAHTVGDKDCDKNRTLGDNDNTELGENDTVTSENINNKISDKIESDHTFQSDLKTDSAKDEKSQPEPENHDKKQLDQSMNDKNQSETELNGSVRSNLSIQEQSVSPGNEKEKSTKKNKKLKQRKNSLPDHVLNSLNMKPAKPILVPVTDDSAIPAARTRSGDNSNEQKSVKFSDDTVFNDHKPNKYKQERVTLKDIYKGKISNKEAVAKLNPMFIDEDNQGIKDGDSENQNDLNTPAYMKDFVITHGTSVRRPGLEVDNDIESIGSEGAVNYDKLIERTLARKRRSRILRFSCALFTFLVVIAVVIVLVMFVGKKQS